MPSSAALAAVAGVAVFGVLGVAVIGGSVSDPSTATMQPGVPDGLAPGAVPARYVRLVTAAGAVCAPFSAPYIAAQLQVESGFHSNAVSLAGAEGIAQFMPETWAMWGRDFDGNGTSSPFDPGDAVPAQAAYDCWLAGQMATALAGGAVMGRVTDLALAGYNAGPAAVLAAGGIPAIAETRHYVTEIDAIAAQDSPLSGGVPGAGVGAATVSVALSYLGLPYVWGGGNTAGPTTGLAGLEPAGFDCSGLVLRAVYAATDGAITLPHDSNIQARQGVLVEQGAGAGIDFSLLQPGDVIAFELDPGDGDSPDGHYSHIGIYIGDHTLLHASHPGPTGGVKIESLDEAYWSHVWWTVRRYGFTPSPVDTPWGSKTPSRSGVFSAAHRSPRGSAVEVHHAWIASS